jgi:hypothetical protein
LVPALQQLDAIITTGNLFSSAAKEKAWQIFYRLQPSVIQKLMNIVNNKQLAAFLSLRIAEEIIIENTQCSNSPVQFNSKITLGTGERDIIAYIAGFILFRCKKKLSPSLDIKKYMSKLIDSDGNTKLISIKSRGGLTQPSYEAINFFVMLELVFRTLSTTVKVPSLQQFTDTMCSEYEAVSTFYDCTYHSESNASIQEKMFLTVLSIFHKVRCHARCRQLMENYHSKTQTVSKQKALRKCID